MDCLRIFSKKKEEVRKRRDSTASKFEKSAEVLEIVIYNSEKPP
jgi:hypothetical protein